jgi:pimeloyl-ACP methyl ester carboxylesterase
VLETSCNEPAVVVGHSMGVRVTLELLRRAPQRVRGVVLLCGSVDQGLGAALAPISGVLSRMLAAGAHLSGPAGHLKQMATRGKLIPELAYMFGGMCRERTPREPVEALLRNIRRMKVEALLHLGRSYLAHSGRALLADVEVPALVIGGERDGLAPPEHCLGIARALPDAELWIAPGCTHLALVEDPAGVNAQIERFVARVT